MKIAWLAPYSIDRLVSSGLTLTRPAGGHACSWIVNWGRALARQSDIDLHIITYSPRVPASQSIRHEGYTVHVLRDAIPFTDRAWAGILDLDARTGFKHRLSILSQKIEELKPDVVHGHGTEDAYGLAAVRSKIPSVVSIQGIINDYLKTNPCVRFKLTARTELQTVAYGKNFMCRTHFDKAFVSSVNPQATIYHMPEPMNPCFFELERDEVIPPRILHVGGFHERKGLADLLHAFKKIHEVYPDVFLDVVGSGDSGREAVLHDLVQRLGISSKIVWHGFKSSEDIAKLHAGATVFAITSQNENSPNTLAEALCAGTPSVAYDVGGISSMFKDSSSGFLVQGGDISGLAEKIMLLISSPKLRASFSEISRRDGAANHPDRVATTSLGAYENIIK